MLQLTIPFGGSGTSYEAATLGLSLAVGSSQYGDFGPQDWFSDESRAFSGSMTLTETPFLRTGFTLDGEPYLAFDYVRMTPDGDKLGGFFEGDMDGGEIFIFGAVIGAGLGVLYLLNEEFGAQEVAE